MYVLWGAFSEVLVGLFNSSVDVDVQQQAGMHGRAAPKIYHLLPPSQNKCLELSINLY